MGYMVLCGSAILVVNMVSILVINRVWFCTLVLKLVCILEKATFSSHKYGKGFGKQAAQLTQFF